MTSRHLLPVFWSDCGIIGAPMGKRVTSPVPKYQPTTAKARNAANSVQLPENMSARFVEVSGISAFNANAIFFTQFAGEPPR